MSVLSIMADAEKRRALVVSRKLRENFYREFPELSLGEIIKNLGTRRSVGEIIKNLGTRRSVDTPAVDQQVDGLTGSTVDHKLDMFKLDSTIKKEDTFRPESTINQSTDIFKHGSTINQEFDTFIPHSAINQTVGTCRYDSTINHEDIIRPYSTINQKLSTFTLNSIINREHVFRHNSTIDSTHNLDLDTHNNNRINPSTFDYKICKLINRTTQNTAILTTDNQSQRLNTHNEQLEYKCQNGNFKSNTNYSNPRFSTEFFDYNQSQSPNEFDYDQPLTPKMFDYSQPQAPINGFDHDQPQSPNAFDHYQPQSPNAFDHDQPQSPNANDHNAFSQYQTPRSEYFNDILHRVETLTLPDRKCFNFAKFCKPISPDGPPGCTWATFCDLDCVLTVGVAVLLTAVVFFSQRMYQLTSGQTDGQTDGQTNGGDGDDVKAARCSICLISKFWDWILGTC